MPSTRVHVLGAALLTLVGAALLALPASVEGPVLVPVSDGHGLSAVDSVGAAALALGLTWLEVLVVWRLPRLGLGPRMGFGAGLAAGLGLGLIVASVFGGWRWWWTIGAAALTATVLALAARLATR